MTRPDPEVDDPAAVQAADDQAARVESDRLNTTDEGRPMTVFPLCDCGRPVDPPTQRVSSAPLLCDCGRPVDPPTQRVVQTGSLATGETFGVNIRTEADGWCDRCPHLVADHNVGGCKRCPCSLPHGGY